MLEEDSHEPYGNLKEIVTSKEESWDPAEDMSFGLGFIEKGCLV
jgi:hypothetical protein